MRYKIKEVANLAGVSVRTLHHYDQIGLLKPDSVNEAGYRHYSRQNLERLQQILFFKELGFDLRAIKQILDSPGFDRLQALEAHRKALQEKKKRLEALIGSVEKTIESIKGGIEMPDKELFSSFNMEEIKKHQQQYAEEAKQKYGHSEAYRESQARVARYDETRWAEIMARSDVIYRTLAGLMDRDPADPEVQEAVDQWRQLISDNFYNCSLEIFRGLGDLYVDDPRFTASIDKYGSGLARFMREAMHCYCDRQEEQCR